MKRATIVAIAIILALITSTASSAQLLGQNQGQAQGQAQGQIQGQSQVQGQAQGQGQVQAQSAQANNLGNVQTSVNVVEQTIGMEVTNPRQMPGLPYTGNTLFPSFYDDPANLPDWRVSPANELLAELGGVADLEDMVRLSDSGCKIGDGLLREVYVDVKRVQFITMATTDMRLLGNVAAFATSDKVQTANCVGSAVAYAMKKGATHLMLIKDGYRRAGTFFGWHIGLGGGASGVMNDAGANATGGAASIGPGVTSAESMRVDRPYVSFKAYYLAPPVPTPQPKAK